MNKDASFELQGPVQKILIIDLGGIGDILLSTSALKILQERFPEASLTSLVLPGGKELLEGLPYLRKIVSFPVSERELAHPFIGFRPGKLTQLLRVGLDLRRSAFDLIINFRPLNSRASAVKMALLVGLIGAPMVVGRDTGSRGFFLTHRISEEGLEGHHEIDYVLRVVYQLGGKKEIPPLEIVFDGKEDRKVDELLSRQGILPAKHFITFHPGAPFESKRWPLSCFIGVAEKLRKKRDVAIVIVGREEEIPLGEAFKAALGEGAVSLCGETTVKELCFLLKRSLLFVGNDSAPMHLAAYVGTPLVALFHSGTARYYPLGNRERIIVLGGSDEKSFWEKHRSRGRGVLDTISDEEVFQAAQSLLERHGPPRR